MQHRSEKVAAAPWVIVTMAIVLALWLGTVLIAGSITPLPPKESVTVPAAGTQGSILYDDGTVWQTLAPGASGDFLKTLGAGADPAWASVPTGNVTATGGGLVFVNGVQTAQTGTTLNVTTPSNLTYDNAGRLKFGSTAGTSGSNQLIFEANPTSSTRAYIDFNLSTEIMVFRARNTDTITLDNGATTLAGNLTVRGNTNYFIPVSSQGVQINSGANTAEIVSSYTGGSAPTALGLMSYAGSVASPKDGIWIKNATKTVAIGNNQGGTDELTVWGTLGVTDNVSLGSRLFVGQPATDNNQTVKIKLSDAAGADSMSILDSASVTRCKLDSLGRQTLSAGTLPTGTSIFAGSGTLADAAAAQVGYDFQATGSGSSTVYKAATRNQLNAGYTGGAITMALYNLNNSAGTGAYEPFVNNTGLGANYGFYNAVQTSTSGSNYGGFANARSGATVSCGLLASVDSPGAGKNYGTFGRVEGSSAGGNVGAVGTATNSGAGTAVGGFFSCNTAAVPTFVSAALLADNYTANAPIFVARDNGTEVFRVADEGAIRLAAITGAVAGATSGDLWHHSTQGALKTFTSGVTSTWTGSLYEATAGVSVTATGGGGSSSLPTGVGNLNLPANFFKAGKHLRIKLAGLYTSTAGTNSFNLEVKYGSVSLVSKAITVNANQTDASWEAIFDVVCRSAGAPGAVAVTTKITDMGTTLAIVGSSVVPPLDTTAAGQLDVLGTVGDAGDSIDTVNASVEVLN